MNFKKWLRKSVYTKKKNIKIPIGKIDVASYKEDIQVDGKIQNL